jgi:Ca2+-binding RTX toxin-like protein
LFEFFDADGVDLMDGGAGRDRVSHLMRSDDIVASLIQGRANDGDLINNVEELTGGFGNDLLYGDDSPNRLVGLGGNDTLIGLGGNDYLHLDQDRFYLYDPTDQPSGIAIGGSGNDVLLASSNLATLQGGDGNDLLLGVLWESREDYIVDAADTVPQVLDGGAGRDFAVRRFVADLRDVEVQLAGFEFWREPALDFAVANGIMVDWAD